MQFDCISISIARAYALGVDINTGGPTTEPFPAGSTNDFNEAAAAGRVSPSNWQDLFPTGWALNDFDWKADYRPKARYTHRVPDRWNLDGYAGQAISVEKPLQDMIHSSRRYWFRVH